MKDKIKSYGLIGTIEIFFNLIYTKIFFKNAKIVRKPIFIRGKENIKIGKGFTTGRFCRIEVYSNKKDTITIGDNCQINDNVHIGAINNIKIGNNVLIASKVFISDHDHGYYKGEYQSSPLEPPVERRLNSSPIIIENNVWIGEFCAILKGVKIGEGSIIATHSTVLKDVEPYTIVAGSPAKVIKKYNFESKEWETVG